MPQSYTTAAALDARCSALGVDLRTDHAPTDSLEQSIEMADSQIEFYCQARYDPAALASSRWVATAALMLATYHLCWLRLNPVPGPVAAEYERILAELTRVQDGKAVIPGIPRGKSSAPTVTNQRVVLNRYPELRVEKPRSTGTAEGYPRRVDPTADAINEG